MLLNVMAIFNVDAPFIVKVPECVQVTPDDGSVTFPYTEKAELPAIVIPDAPVIVRDLQLAVAAIEQVAAGE